MRSKRGSIVVGVLQYCGSAGEAAKVGQIQESIGINPDCLQPQKISPAFGVGIGIAIAFGLWLPMPDGDCDPDTDSDNVFPAALRGSSIKATGFAGEYLIWLPKISDSTIRSWGRNCLPSPGIALTQVAICSRN